MEIFPKKINLWENFHNNLLCWKISTKIVFSKKFLKITLCWKVFTKKNLLENFHKNRLYYIFSTKKCNVGKSPQKISFHPPLPHPHPHSLKMSKSKVKRLPRKNPKQLRFQVDPPPLLAPKKFKLLYFLIGLPYRKL